MGRNILCYIQALSLTQAEEPPQQQYGGVGSRGGHAARWNSTAIN